MNSFVAFTFAPNGGLRVIASAFDRGEVIAFASAIAKRDRINVAVVETPVGAQIDTIYYDADL